MGDVLISSLMPGDCSRCMCVRVSRLWDFSDPQDDSRLLHTDLVLLDEEGNSIHAQIYPPLCQQFKPMIDEGSVYNLKYFMVRKANRLYRPVENSNMLTFTKWTTVEVVLQIPPAFPVYTYNLTPIEQLETRRDHNEYFTDVLGVITMVSHVSPVRTRARQGEVLKRTVTIRGSSAGYPILSVALWAERAASFPAEQVHKDGQTSPQIVIFVGTLVRSYDGNLSLTGGSSCKWYINASVPEVAAIQTSDVRIHQPIMWEQNRSAAEPATFAIPEHRELRDIKYLHPFENKKKEWLVTVKVLKVDSSWWYNSCRKCLWTARPHGDTYKCSDSRCDTIGAPTPRYKICMAAKDSTDTAEFVLFGRIAQRLIKKTVDTLISTNPPGFIPDEITSLLEKTFEWNVSFTENTRLSSNISFQVNAINAELDGGKTLPLTPASQSSSIVISQAGMDSDATPPKPPLPTRGLSLTPESHREPSKHENITQKGTGQPVQTAQERPGLMPAPPVLQTLPATSADPAGHEDGTSDVADGSATKTRRAATGKRTRGSPSKRVAKRLLVDDDGETDDDSGTLKA